MKIEEVQTVPGELLLTVEATSEEVDKAFEYGLEAFIQQFQLEALEGETPLDKINNAVGEDRSGEVIMNAVLNYLIPHALKEKNIIPLSSSKTDALTKLTQGEPFTFTMTVVPKPSFALSDYSTFTVTVPQPMAVTEKDIDEQVEMVAKEYAEQTQAASGADEAGEQAPVTIPAVTDTWVQQTFASMGINTVAELRETLRENSQKVLDEQYQEMVIGALMDVYFERFQGEITDVMVDAMTTDMLESFKAELVQQDIEFDAYCQATETSEDTIRESLKEQAKVQLIQGFIFDAIFEHEKLTVEVPDLMAMVHMIAPGEEEKTFDLMEKTGRTFLLKEGAQRNKALAWMLENNKIVSPVVGADTK